MSAGQQALHIPPSLRGVNTNQSAPHTLSSVLPVYLRAKNCLLDCTLTYGTDSDVIKSLI